MLGGNLFQPVIGKLLDMNWTGTMIDGARVYSPLAYQYALVLMPIGIILSLVIMFFIRETRCEIQTEEP
jgi:hypothetical protein